MKRWTWIILGLLITTTGMSQVHYAGFSQYMFNGLAINPAYAGTRDVFTISGSYKKQWTGIEGAPELQTLSVHWPGKKKKVGLGFSLLNETEDIKSNLQIFGNYAYRVPLGSGTLSMGLRAGAMIHTEDYAELLTLLDDPNDPFYAESISNNKTYLNIGTGFYYFTDQFYVGLSIPLMSNYLADSVAGDFKFSISPLDYTYYLTAGALVVSKDKFKWKPSMLLKYHASYGGYQVDINSNFILFNDLLWIGGSYRTGLGDTGSTLIGMVELKIGDKIMLGYSYDQVLGGLNTYLRGTHEVFLRFELIKRIRASNPRYF